MPRDAPLPPAVRLILRPGLGIVTLALIVYLLGAGFGPLDGAMGRWAALVLELGAALGCILRVVYVKDERWGWGLIAAAVLAWAVGDAIWRALYYSGAHPPDFTAADALWLVFYPLAYGGIALLIRERVRRVSFSIWVDGLIAALAMSSLTAAIVLNAVTERIGGTSIGTAVNLAYVLGDGLLLALVLIASALTGWRFDRAWALLGGALVLFAVSDSLYLYQAAQGTYAAGGLLDAGWATALLLVCVAAWSTSPALHAPPRTESWRSIALPIAFGVLGLGILVYDHSNDVTTPALLLATAALAAVLGRLAMTFGENLRMLRASRAQAITDALTGLPNRRALMRDLELAFGGAGSERRRLLALLDLDGFKAYNDTFGHPAGDALLTRLGGKLGEQVAPWGCAYRMGGDEFCVLLQFDGQRPELLASLASSALGEQGDGYEVASSIGWAVLPDEAGTPTAALGLVDSRMYAHKLGRRDEERRRGERRGVVDRRQDVAAGLP